MTNNTVLPKDRVVGLIFIDNLYLFSFLMKCFQLFLFTAVLAIFSIAKGYAQSHLSYKYSKTLDETADSYYMDSLPNNLPPGKKNLIKQQGDKLIILSQTKDENNIRTFKVKKYNLGRYKTTNIWRCDIADTIVFTDFCLLPKNILLLLTNDRLYFFDVVKNKLHKSTVHPSNLREIDIINDNQYLLYDIYPFHPFDGISKVTLHIYDVNKGCVTVNREVPLEGISLGNAVSHWLRVINHKIYIVAPLTGKITIYDNALKEIGNFKLPISGIDNKRNQEFVWYMDKQMLEADNDLNKLRKERGDEYIKTHDINSPYYNKDALRKRLDTFQKYYSYVEKLFSLDDSTMIVSISKSEYGMMFRDLYFVNLTRKIVVDSIIGWRTFPPRKDSVTRIEDYFTVPLPMATMQEPFFYNRKVYTPSDYPTSLFKIGAVKELDNEIFKWQKRNISTWSVLEYTMQ